MSSSVAKAHPPKKHVGMQHIPKTNKILFILSPYLQ
jgi:hypothetical protein